MRMVDVGKMDVGVAIMRRQPGPQVLVIPRLAFPDLKHAPTRGLQQVSIPLIPLHVRSALLYPEILVRRRLRLPVPARVHVPEASVDKEHGLCAREHEVGLPRQLFSMEAIPQTGGVQNPPHTQLGNGIPRADIRHIETALGGRMNVGHKS